MPLIIEPKWVAVAVFLAVYLLIMLGLRELTVASLAGVTILFITGILSWEEMWHYMEFDVLALLIGVMIVARVMRHVGFFRWLGIHMANLARCDPMRMLVLFVLVSVALTAFAGATVVVALMMSLVVMDIMDILELDPRPFILAIVFAVNIAGMSTSVSSLPTILIAETLDLDFWSFAANMWILTASGVGGLLAMLLLFSRHELSKMRPRFRRMPVEPQEVIADKRMFYFCTAMFFAMVFGFATGFFVGLKPGAVAILTASVALLVAGHRVGPVVREVDWETVLSITCLLILVGALEKTGAIHDLAHAIHPLLTAELLGPSALLWLSALISAVIDNVPFTTVMIPTLHEISPDAGPLWWALAAGTCLGGNGTVIASYANLVVVGAASERGYRIDPKAFAKRGMTLVLATTCMVNLALLIALASS